MGFVHLTRHVRATPEEVFDLASQVDRLPAWLEVVDTVQSGPARLDHVDARFTALMRLGPKNLAVEWVVTKYEPAQVLQLSGSSDEGGEADALFEAGRWNNETEFQLDLEYELPGGFVTSMADRIWIERSIAHDLKRSLRNLAAMVEHP